MNVRSGRSIQMRKASIPVTVGNTHTHTHTDPMTVDAGVNLFIQNQLVMAKTKITSNKKIIHSLPCGCKCYQAGGHRPYWERCFKGELLAEQFGMGNITLNEYSNHFKLNQNEQTESTWSGW